MAPQAIAPGTGPGLARERAAERALGARYRARVVLFTLFALLAAGALAAGFWASTAMVEIAKAERDRDTWQRPQAALAALDLTDGEVVADIGSGVGYFTLKMSARVGARGRVLAVDKGALPLLMLRLRALLGARGNVFAIHGDAARVPLPAAGVDAVLVANTYHELADPAAVLEHAREALRPGGRVVVLDPAAEAAAGGAAHGVHDHVSAETAAAGLRQAGFELVARDDGFVHDQGRSWWLLTARKPLPPSAAGGP